MIRAATSLVFQKKGQPPHARQRQKWTTSQTSKTPLFQAVLRETYCTAYGRAVLALVSSYPGYCGSKGMIPDYTALSDWLCQLVANSLVKDYSSEGVEKGSPQGEGLVQLPPTHTSRNPITLFRMRFYSERTASANRIGVSSPRCCARDGLVLFVAIFAPPWPCPLPLFILFSRVSFSV